MVLFYNLSIRFYVLIVRIAAFFNPKAKQWVDGRKSLFPKIEEAIKGEENLGNYESI